MTPAPPPVASPEHKDEVADTATGRFKALKRGFRVEKIISLSIAGIALLISIGSLMGGYRVFLSDAKAQTKEEVKAETESHDRRLTSLENLWERHLADEDARDRRRDDSEYRQALELRELQKVFLTGRSSPVLNEPPTKPQ